MRETDRNALLDVHVADVDGDVIGADEGVRPGGEG